MHLPHKHTTHHIHTPTEHTRMHNNTWAHSYEQSKHAYLQSNITAVMLVLEPKAALKAFKPASVTLRSPVCV